MRQTNYLKHIFVSLCICISSICLAQEAEEKEMPEHEKEAIQQVFAGNEQMLAGTVLEGEKSYRTAISKDPNNMEAKYNLGYSYYKTKNYQEAAQRNKEAVKNAKTKAEKHIANHNLGNSYLQMGKPDEAIEAYKNALRNNPGDDETRYNLAVARQMKEQQDQQKDQQQNKDEKGDDKDKKDSDKGDEEKKEDGKKKEGDDEKDPDKDKEGDKDEKEDEDGKDEKEKDGDKGDGEEEKDKKPAQPREGKLSPEQVKSLLEAMAEEEKKVQDKMNENKARGVKVKSGKDW